MSLNVLLASIGRLPRVRTIRDAHIASTQWPGQRGHDNPLNKLRHNPYFKNMGFPDEWPQTTHGHCAATN